jgi:hypothetical protein
MTFLATSSESCGFPADSSPEQERRLASYLLNRHRGVAAVRDILVADIRGFLDLGQPHIAADLVAVLRLLLSRCPEASRDLDSPFAWDDATPDAGLC